MSYRALQEKVYAIKPQEEQASAMAYTNTNVCAHLSLGVRSCTITKVCTHLSLGVCPCTTTNETQASGFSTKKRKLRNKATNGARKKALRWWYSTELMLYDDPWKIKKVLKESDLGNMSRLLLGTELAEDLVLPVLGGADADKGIQVSIWDVDTNSMHSLLFKRWVSSRSYVFMGKWVKDFVIRRALKKGDEIGLYWDPYNYRFNFSVLQQPNQD